MDFYPTTLDLLDIKMPDQIEPIDGISLLPLIDGQMNRRPKPIPLVSGRQVRLIDNEYTLQKGRLFAFADGGRTDVDVTEQEPEVLARLAAWENEWRATVKKDQAAYNVKRR